MPWLTGLDGSFAEGKYQPYSFGLIEFDQLSGERRDRDGMRLKVLGLGPIDNPFLSVPLVDMESGDLFDALAGQHDEAAPRADTKGGRECRDIRASDRAGETRPRLSQRVPWTLGSVGKSEAGLKGIRNRRGDVFR